MEKRVEWIDITKGIAIFMMIAGHIALLPWEPYGKIIFSVHMPLFFILSGYTSKREFSWGYFKKLWNSLLIPYFLCILIEILFYSITSNIIWTAEIKRVFWASGVPANYGPGVPIFGKNEDFFTVGAIWFLPCMFWCKLFFSIILKYTEKFHKNIRHSIIILIVCLGYFIGQKYKLPMGIDIAAFSIGFMYAGYLIKKENIMDKKIISLGIGSMILWYLAIRCDGIELSARYYREFPACIFSFFGAIAGTYVLAILSKEIIVHICFIKEICLFFGKNSLIMLCLHHLEGNFISLESMITNAVVSLDIRWVFLIVAFARIAFVGLAGYIFLKIKRIALEMLQRKYTVNS